MVEVSEENFDPTYMGLLLLMAINCESAFVNWRMAWEQGYHVVLYYNVGPGTGMTGHFHTIPTSCAILPSTVNREIFVT